MRHFLFFILAITLTQLSPGATINVPGDYETLQAAIDAAANGDHIIVSNDTESFERVPARIVDKELKLTSAPFAAVYFEIENSKVELSGEWHGSHTVTDSEITFRNYYGFWDFGARQSFVRSDINILSSFVEAYWRVDTEESNFEIIDSVFKNGFILVNQGVGGNVRIQNSYSIRYVMHFDEVTAENSQVGRIVAKTVWLVNCELRGNIQADSCTILDSWSGNRVNIAPRTQRSQVLISDSVFSGMDIEGAVNALIERSQFFAKLSPGAYCSLLPPDFRPSFKEPSRSDGISITNCFAVIIKDSMLQGGESGPTGNYCIENTFIFRTGIPGIPISAIDSNVTIEHSLLIPGGVSPDWPRAKYIEGNATGSIIDETIYFVLYWWPPTMGGDKNDDGIIDVADLAVLNPDELLGLSVTY